MSDFALTCACSNSPHTLLESVSKRTGLSFSKIDKSRMKKSLENRHRVRKLQIYALSMHLTLSAILEECRIFVRKHKKAYTQTDFCYRLKSKQITYKCMKHVDLIERRKCFLAILNVFPPHYTSQEEQQTSSLFVHTELHR